MGGGFGGKESQASQWAAHRRARGRGSPGRPASSRLDRDDDMAMTGKRHDFRVDYDVGFDDDGPHPRAATSTFAARCGYSADLSAGIADRALFHADNAYSSRMSRTVHSRRMKTHTGLEHCLSRVRRTAGNDRHREGHRPHRLGARHGPARCAQAQPLRRGRRDITPYGQEVADNIAPALIDALELSSDYRARREAIAAFNRRARCSRRASR